MKKLLFILLSIFSISTLVAQDTMKVKSEIKKVTVFLSGAEVSREVKVSLTKGLNNIMLTGLEAEMFENSIRVTSDKEISLQSVIRQMNFMRIADKSQTVKNLEKRKKELEFGISVEQTKNAVLKEEEDLVVKNNKLSSDNELVNIEELKAGTEFYNSRLSEINLKQLEISEKIIKMNNEVIKIRQQLQELNSATETKTSEIIISILSESAVNATLTVSYIVNNASWTPKYDIRVAEVNKPIEWIYKADVRQSTGHDWKNVQLSFSTGQPFENAQKPELTAWTLKRYYVRDTYDNYGNALAKVYDEYGREINESKTTSAKFVVEQPYTIPTNNKDFSVEVTKYLLAATYEYSVVPKLDLDAFLMAKITDWEQLSLINGEINLFFEGTYVGKSMLNVGTTKDTLLVSLGRDKNVIVTRTKLKEFSKKQFLSSKKSEMTAWEISVRNNKKQTISLIVEDQFPISNIKDIEVERQETSGGEYDQNTGKILWRLQLAPTDNKKINFRYLVKYPAKSKVVIE